MRALAWVAAFTLVLALTPGASPAAASRVVVKLRAEGPHAVEACAETLARARGRFRSATADRSDSLDRLHARLGIRRVRALFRRPDGRPFALQRAGLARRLEAARQRFPGRARRRPRARTLPDLAHVYRVELGAPVSAAQAAALYARDPHVAWAQPDHAAGVQWAPDDPFLGSSGSWGQPYRDLWGLERIGVERAWDRTRGEGIVVAVVDTGIDYAHPDLEGNLWVNPGEDLDGDGRAGASDRNGLDDDDNGFVDDLYGFDFAGSLDSDGDGAFDGPGDASDPDPFDDNGHGTHVAGTIAALADNGLGIAGVAPRARVMAVKALGASGNGTMSDLARAMVYAAENGADVINNSWSCNQRCPRNPVAEEAVRLAHGLGVLIVHAAGNSAEDVQSYSPQLLPETLTVAATTERDEPAFFSNSGFLVDLAAPGGGSTAPPPGLSPFRNVLSLRASVVSPDDPLVVGGDYRRLAGTSMATPHVSGVAALVLAQRPELDPEQVRALLRLTARDVGPPGPDVATGAGRVDADAATRVAVPPRVRASISMPAPGDVPVRAVRELEITGTAAGDAFLEYVLLAGAGSAPEAWTPLGPAARRPVEQGVLGRWPLEGLASGPHVLRLSVRARDGSVIDALVPVSLERNPPSPVSSPGAAAHAPAVAGSLVAWHSERPAIPPASPDGEAASDDGVNLFVTDLWRRAEHALAHGPGSQHLASISGRRIAWNDSARPATGIASCRYERRRGACAAAPVEAGFGLPSPPVVGGDRIVWSELRGGPAQLWTCRAGPAGCPPAPVDPAPGSQDAVDFDGRRLVWQQLEVTGDVQIQTCLLDPASGECPAHAVDPVRPIQLEPAVDGDLIAWLDLGGAELEVHACRLDANLRSCPSRRLFAADDIGGLGVSGDRIIWHASVGDELADVFFCEHEHQSGACRVQRLTVSPLEQREPAIDGDRVAFEDLRSGPSAIVTLRLPTLDPLADRSVAAGRPLLVRVRARDPEGGRPALRATLADGRPVEALGARFRDLGNGRGLLAWRPRADQLGAWTFRVTAESAGRLETRKTLQIQVLDPRRVRRP